MLPAALRPMGHNLELRHIEEALSTERLAGASYCGINVTAQTVCWLCMRDLSRLLESVHVGQRCRSRDEESPGKAARPMHDHVALWRMYLRIVGESVRTDRCSMH